MDYADSCWTLKPDEYKVFGRVSGVSGCYRIAMPIFNHQQHIAAILLFCMAMVPVNQP